MIIAPRTMPNILDSNIPIVEDGIPVWDSSKTYKLKDKVQINNNVHRIYQAIQDVPKDINPVDDVNKNTGIGEYWFDRGATNYMRAFDELGSSQCVFEDEIYYKFGISDQDIILLENIHNVSSVKIVLKNIDNNHVILDKTIHLKTREVYDWFDWTYVPFEYEKSFFTKIPLIYNATLELRIKGEGDIKVGHIAYGRSQNVGLSLIKPSPKSSIRGIISKSRDEFGNIITRRKARYKRMSINCLIESKSIDVVENRLNNLADTPCIFVGDDREGGYKSLLIYGELKDHDMPISISKTQYQLEIEGYL